MSANSGCDDNQRCGRCSMFPTYLVDLGLDEEELNQGGRAVNGCVDVLQSQAGSVGVVKVLCQEVLNPEQGGGRLCLSIICANIYSLSPSIYCCRDLTWKCTSKGPLGNIWFIFYN